MNEERGLLDRIIRRVFVVATILLAGYCVFKLVDGGSGREWIMAGVCASFPLAAWWEASQLRKRGLPEAADAIVAWAFAAVLGFSFLVDYAADLRVERIDRVGR